MTDMPERMWAWAWQLPYPSKSNGRAEWSSMAYPDDQDAIQYVRCDTVAALRAENARLSEALSEIILASNNSGIEWASVGMRVAERVEDIARAALDAKP